MKGNLCGFLKVRLVGILTILSCWQVVLTAQEILVSEDFQSGRIDTTWLNIDNDGSEPNETASILADWSVGEQPSAWKVLPKRRNFDFDNLAVASLSWFNTDTVSADNWLILPRLEGAENEIITLRFQWAVQQADFPDGFRLLKSTTGSEPEDFNEVIFEQCSGCEQCAQYNCLCSENCFKNELHWWKEILLIEDEGPFYLAFHHDAHDQYVLYLDDIEIERKQRGGDFELVKIESNGLPGSGTTELLVDNAEFAAYFLKTGGFDPGLTMSGSLQIIDENAELIWDSELSQVAFGTESFGDTIKISGNWMIAEPLSIGMYTLSFQYILEDGSGEVVKEMNIDRTLQVSEDQLSYFPQDENDSIDTLNFPEFTREGWYGHWLNLEESKTLTHLSVSLGNTSSNLPLKLELLEEVMSDGERQPELLASTETFSASDSTVIHVLECPVELESNKDYFLRLRQLDAGDMALVVKNSVWETVSVESWGDPVATLANDIPALGMSFQEYGPIEGIEIEVETSSLSITTNAFSDAIVCDWSWVIGADTFSGNSAEYTFEEEGSYEICVTGSNAFGSLTECQEVVVTCHLNLSASATAFAATIAVSNGTLPYEYAWSVAANDSLIEILGPNGAGLTEGTEYEVVVVDATGCTDSILVTTLSCTLEAEIEIDTLNYTVSVITSGGVEPLSFDWSSEDSTAVVQHLPLGDHEVTVTDSIGCSQTFEFSIDTATSNETILPAELKWYPNPATDRITLELGTHLMGARVKLVDLTGKVVYNQKVDRLRTEIAIESLPKGLYLLHINEPAGSRQYTDKLLLK